MLDIILIQDAKSGVKLLDYRQESTPFKSEHSDIFTGFLSAMQNISKELNIGTVVLISTIGERGHNCILVPYNLIYVILLVDKDDSVDFWKKQGNKVASKFIEIYGNNFSPYEVGRFKTFIPILKEICYNCDFHD